MGKQNRRNHQGLPHHAPRGVEGEAKTCWQVREVGTACRAAPGIVVSGNTCSRRKSPRHARQLRQSGPTISVVFGPAFPANAVNAHSPVQKPPGFGGGFWMPPVRACARVRATRWRGGHPRSSINQATIQEITMSAAVSTALQEFALFIQSKLTNGETKLSPEEVLDEIQVALDEVNSGEKGISGAESVRRLRERAGIPTP